MTLKIATGIFVLWALSHSQFQSRPVAPCVDKYGPVPSACEMLAASKGR